MTTESSSRNPDGWFRIYARRAFSLVELLVVLAIISILAALLLPVFSHAKDRAKNAVCTNNLWQLGVAVRLYSEDNNNLLPNAEILPTDPIDPQHPLPRICDVLAIYAGKTTSTNEDAQTIFKCPCDNLNYFSTEGSSYEWNADLNGQCMDQTESKHLYVVTKTVNGPVISTNFTLQFLPETTPLLLDYDEFHPRPPQSGKNVVYMDGHVAPLNVSPN